MYFVQNKNLKNPTSNIPESTSKISKFPDSKTPITNASNSDQVEINCINQVNDLIQIDKSLVNVNSLTDQSFPLSTNIKKKSSSFLHRDYNRKPILARSQVSIIIDD